MTTDTKKDGGPAFPAPAFAVPSALDREKVLLLGKTQGMTLRDWFAGMALQGLLAYPGEAMADSLPSLAYEYADAMLKARDA